MIYRKKKNMENVKTLFIDGKRVVGIINEDTYVYGSKSILIKPLDINQMCPLYKKEINNIKYKLSEKDKFPKYKENNDIWGNESSYSLIEVYPHKKNI
jgi:hypothetical protein